MHLEAEAQALRVDFEREGMIQSELSAEHQSSLKSFRERLDALKQKQDDYHEVEMLLSLEPHQCPALDETQNDIQTLELLYKHKERLDELQNNIEGTLLSQIESFKVE